MGKPKRPRYEPAQETYSAPLAIPLTHESSWAGCGSSLGPFHVVRFNFILEKSPLRVTGYGDAVAHLESLKGAELTDRRLIRYEYERVSTSTIIEEHLTNSEITSSIQADAQVEATGLATFKYASQIESHLSHAYRENFQFEVRDGRKTTVEREISFRVTGGSPPGVLAVPFRRWAMKVRLNHIDFLTVTYVPRAGKWRMERLKEPVLLSSTSMQANYRPSGLSLGEFKYWVPLGDADTTLVDRDLQYERQINPLDVAFEATAAIDRQFYDLNKFRKKTPSLYKIANAAFPLKAKQRDTAWTDDELLKLLDIEPKEAVWIWEYRRAIRRKQQLER